MCSFFSSDSVFRSHIFSLPQDWCPVGGDFCNVTYSGEGASAATTDSPLRKLRPRGIGDDSGLPECDMAFSSGDIIPCADRFEHLGTSYYACTTASMPDDRVLLRWCLVGPYQWEYCRRDCLRAGGGGSGVSPAPAPKREAPPPRGDNSSQMDRDGPAPDRRSSVPAPARQTVSVLSRKPNVPKTPRPPVSTYTIATTDSSSSSTTITSTTTAHAAVGSTRGRSTSAAGGTTADGRSTSAAATTAVSKTTVVKIDITTTTSLVVGDGGDDPAAAASDVARDTVIGVAVGVSVAIVVIVVAVIVAMRRYRRGHPVGVFAAAAGGRSGTAVAARRGSSSSSSSRRKHTDRTVVVQAHSAEGSSSRQPRSPGGTVSTVRLGPNLALSGGKRYQSVATGGSSDHNHRGGSRFEGVEVLGLNDDDD